MGLISVAVILLIAIFLAWSRHQKQVQRDADAKYRDQREANEGRPLNRSGGSLTIAHASDQTAKHSAYVFRSTRTQANGRTAT